MAKAIVEYAKKFRQEEENHVWPEARDFMSVTGHGVQAIVGNKALIVGNKSLMVDSGIHIPEEASEILMEAEEQAQTGIIVAMNQEVVGIISISDPLKPGASEVISILKSMNIKSIMVTGDNWGTARAIAQEVGIDSVVAEATPAQKAEKVKELQVYVILYFSILGHDIDIFANMSTCGLGMYYAYYYFPLLQIRIATGVG